MATSPSKRWRTIEELAAADSAPEILEGEFPVGASEWSDPVSRRSFLKLMAASVALAGITGCTSKQPLESIVPYVDPPENLLPGRPLFYATAFPLRGLARGIVVEQHEGRPTKIEGNPKHPSSLGATDALTQAAILQLYDPDRSATITEAGEDASWTSLLAAFRQAAAHPQKRIRILTGLSTSSSLADQIQALQKVFPHTKWHQHDPLARDNVYLGTKMAFGQPLLPVYDFLQAERIVALDANFLADDPGSVRYAREFAQRRRVAFKDFGPTESRSAKLGKPSALTPDTMSRLYAAQGNAGITGAVADHHLPLPPSRIPNLLRHLAAAIGQQTVAGPLPKDLASFVTAAAEDLRSHPGRSLIVPGDSQPPIVHAVAHLLNVQLGNIGKSVQFIKPPETHPPITADSLLDLTAALDAGEVDILLIVETNPVYNAPGDVHFAAALQKFSTGGKVAFHLGLYQDETAALCRWHVPLSHFLETWGDARGHDGTTSLLQPLIAPLYESKSAIELLAAFASPISLSPPARDLLRATWLTQWKQLPSDAAREERWLRSLKTGVIADSASAVETLPPAATLESLLPQLAADQIPSAEKLEIAIRPDPCVGDGDFANSGWLQELPKPLSKITWDNGAVISPATAKALGLQEGELVEVAPVRGSGLPASEDSLQAVLRTVPVLIQPGQPDFTVTLHLGYGRTAAGRVANGVGVNVYPLRSRANLWSLSNVQLHRTNGSHTFARTQDHRHMHGRDVARARGVAEVGAAADDRARQNGGVPVHLSLYKDFKYTGYKWGMVVDQSACIGCNACVTACQAENNIPVVGKERVLEGREMQWMRIDTYFGSAEADSVEAAGKNPEVHFQPMLCQHCENAPCEVVCPVGATTHSAEGINEMTYNRCVGTRYCSNNCPYKVRRFNFFLYHDHNHPTLDMQYNPEVTVRSRGVMEKCTYCIQRINRARIEAKKSWVQNDARHLPTDLRHPEPDAPETPETLPAITVITACQQVCPTEAIVFGDMNDADTHVARLKMHEPWHSLSYGVFSDLDTQPRTTYLERFRNPNPALEGHA